MKNYFFNYKYPIIAIGVLLLAAGAFTYKNLQTGLFPNITFPKIKVIADAGQQPVGKMMTAVTIPLENAIRRTEGLSYIKSTTSRGSVEISVFLDWDMDINTAKSQIESYIQQAKENILPNTSFSIEKMNPSILPVMGYSLEGDGSISQVELKKIAKYQIRPYLAAAKGVADIVVIGGKDKEYEIVLKPYALNNLKIGIGDIETAVKNSNILKSTGYLTDYNRMYLTLTDNAVENLKDLEEIVIKSNSNRVIQLKDVADIKVSSAKTYVKVVANGKNVPLIGVVKQPKANLLEVNSQIQKKVSELEKTLPKNVKLVPFYNQANFVNSSIKSIKDVLWIGLVLAILVVIAFLRSFSASMVVVFTIPITVALTLIVLYGIGYTFNIMTLGAIAAAIGLMIDDVVIIIEQIHKIREESEKESVAWCAKEAISKLLPAMIGSSLSTLVIFIPFVMMSGVAGAYFKVMAFTMIIALACSFFTTWFMVPVLSIFFARNKQVGHKHEPKTKWIHIILERPIIGIIFAAICIAIIAMVPSKLPSGFLPEMDEGSIVMDYNSPPGTTLEETSKMLDKVNEILRKQPEVEAFSARLGTQMGFFITEPNRGDYLIKLKDSRNKSTMTVADEIRQKIEGQIPQLTVDFGQVIGDMLGDLMSSVQPIQIKVFGDNKYKLENISKSIAHQVEQVKGTADVFDGIVIAGPEIMLEPKNKMLAKAGLTASDLQSQIQTHIQGKVVSTMIANVQVINIRMMYPDTYQTSVENVRNLNIVLPNGSLVPITRLAKITTNKGVAEVNRENEKSVGYVTARLNNRDLGSTLSEIKKQISKNISLPTSFHIEYGGSYKQQQKAFHELLLILISAILLVFLVILFLFRKIKIAISIVIIAVLGVAGCLLSLLITGTPLNVGSYMGIIMIVGIIGENSIFTYRQYNEVDQSLSHEKKIEYSIAARLRPKLMTAFAAIMALIPLALGIGSGAQLHQPLAIAVIGGMVFALPLLLIVLPTILKLIKE
ncbi:acriflavine resistance protein B [Christiangramia fulva]|uniref:Acriflavine resistance protein B n=1 Tax=Christiangramia fulva TaxID=2126553 RepID=A0A2R3Z4D0_9FLAO|nr:efflux RND transporter permease subunit [Christiangramia fulva]AVR45072.1 acriflavine resistance protein B [Christiangramia fulva]